MQSSGGKIWSLKLTYKSCLRKHFWPKMVKICRIVLKNKAWKHGIYTYCSTCLWLLGPSSHVGGGVRGRMHQQKPLRKVAVEAGVVAGAAAAAWLRWGWWGLRSGEPLGLAQHQDQVAFVLTLLRNDIIHRRLRVSVTAVRGQACRHWREPTMSSCSFSCLITFLWAPARAIT